MSTDNRNTQGADAGIRLLSRTPFSNSITVGFQCTQIRNVRRKRHPAMQPLTNLALNAQPRDQLSALETVNLCETPVELKTDLSYKYAKVTN